VRKVEKMLPSLRTGIVTAGSGCLGMREMVRCAMGEGAGVMRSLR
jgi:hypothetical protein